MEGVPTAFRSVRREFVNSLFNIGAIKFGELTLKSGLKSPIYVDLRLLRSFPRQLRQAALIFWNQLIVEVEGFDLIADVPTAATPIVTAVALLGDVSMITPREPKEHGTKAAIDGVNHPGQSVVVIDDLITTAGSKLKAIKTLEAAGLVVKDVCVLVDREQGGKEELERAGYKLHAAFTLRELLDSYVKDRLISHGQHAEVLRYLDDPLSYGDNRAIKKHQEEEKV